MDKSRWQFVRTERILQSLEEATITRLKADTIRGFPGTRARQNSPDPVRIVQKVYTAYTPSSALLVEALADNQGRQYNPEILFGGVVFEKEDEATNVSFPTTNGQIVHIQPIALAQNNARIRCTCLDFHYRFAHTNAKVQSAYGKLPPPYQKVPGSNRPPANPMQVPGMCKHLIALVEELRRDGVVK